MSSKENHKFKNSFDELTPQVLRLASSLDEITRVMNLIKQNNDELKTFNHAFGTFLHGMAGSNYIHEQVFNDGVHKDSSTRLENPTLPAGQRAVLNKSTSSSSKKTVTIAHQEKAIKRLSADNSVNIGRKKKKDNRELSKMEQEQIKDIIDKLPLEIREDPEYIKNANAILRLFFTKSDGFTLKDMAQQSKIPQFRVTRCVNALIHAKVVRKTPGTQKGQYSTFELLTGQKPGF